MGGHFGDDLNKYSLCETSSDYLGLSVIITSTQQTSSSEATMNHELWVKIYSKPYLRKIYMWHPERRNLVVEHCVLSATENWRTCWYTVIQQLLPVEEIAVYMEECTQSVRITVDQTTKCDVYCICGNCGSSRPRLYFLLLVPTYGCEFFATIKLKHTTDTHHTIMAATSMPNTPPFPLSVMMTRTNS